MRKRESQLQGLMSNMRESMSQVDMGTWDER